jgi:hypothetical protein
MDKVRLAHTEPQDLLLTVPMDNQIHLTAQAAVLVAGAIVVAMVALFTVAIKVPTQAQEELLTEI